MERFNEAGCAAAAWQRLAREGCCVHPAEGVYGLACQPTASGGLEILQHLKDRPLGKPFLLVGAAVDHFLPYLDLQKLSPGWERTLQQSTAAAPISWVMPAAPSTPKALLGPKATIVVRWTAFPPLVELCQWLGSGLVSTSLNLRGAPPARTWEEVLRWKEKEAGRAEEVGFWAAPLGPANGPSEIWDFQSRIRLRP